MNFRIYFLKLAASHPAWRFFISLIHSSIIFFLFFILFALNILQVEIAAYSVFLVPPIMILTYTFLLRRFANPTKLEELFKLKEEKDKEREIERAREKERIDSDRRWREEGERESKERERKKRERERKEEEKRIKDNYLDIGLGHKLPKTIEKIRNPITDKSIIRIDQGEKIVGWGSVKVDVEFNEHYSEKYMPNLLHEIRKEVIEEFIEQEISFPNWKGYIKKNIDSSILKADGKIKLKDLNYSPRYFIHFNLVHSIILSKLIEYFQENGWTLSEDIRKEKVLKTIPLIRSQRHYREAYYLHPPEK